MKRQGRWRVDFTNKVCVVTGASSGIGRRAALDLARRGAVVCVAARREERLRELVAEMGGEDAGHSHRVTDVTKREDAVALGDHVRAVHGRCHVLVNNAGVSRGRGFSSRSIDDLETVMATNFLGAAYCTAALLDLLETSAPSSIVNVASMAGRLAFGGGSAYCASKFALVGWSEALHSELGPRGIHVGSIEPGPLPTEGFPQTGLGSNPLTNLVLTTEEEVSAAIIESIERRKLQRTVPRWFYLLQVPRLLTPPLHRAVRDRLLGAIGRRS